jgi:hypothetical protein
MTGHDKHRTEEEDRAQQCGRNTSNTRHDGSWQ